MSSLQFQVKNGGFLNTEGTEDTEVFLELEPLHGVVNYMIIRKTKGLKRRESRERPSPNLSLLGRGERMLYR